VLKQIDGLSVAVLKQIDGLSVAVLKQIDGLSVAVLKQIDGTVSLCHCRLIRTSNPVPNSASNCRPLYVQTVSSI